MKQFIIDTALIAILWIILFITLREIVGYGERLLVRMFPSKEPAPRLIRTFKIKKIELMKRYSKMGLVISLFLLSILFIHGTMDYQKLYFHNLYALIGDHKIIALIIVVGIYYMVGRIKKITNRTKHTIYYGGKAHHVYADNNQKVKGGR